MGANVSPVLFLNCMASALVGGNGERPCLDSVTGRKTPRRVYMWEVWWGTPGIRSCGGAVAAWGDTVLQHSPEGASASTLESWAAELS